MAWVKLLFFLLFVVHNVCCGNICQADSSQQPFTVVVEGNIGAGKSSLINYFQKNFGNMTLIPEPVEVWQNFGGKNLLELRYSNPKEYYFPFQLLVFKTKLDSHLVEGEHRIKIMERSIYSNYYVFVQNMLRNGNLTLYEYELLREWFDFTTSHLPIRIDLIVYIKTRPENVYERVHERGREEEKILPYSYLENVHDAHEDWLINGKFKNSLPAPVFIVDAKTRDWDRQGAYAQLVEVARVMMNKNR